MKNVNINDLKTFGLNMDNSFGRQMINEIQGKQEKIEKQIIEDMLKPQREPTPELPEAKDINQSTQIFKKKSSALKKSLHSEYFSDNIQYRNCLFRRPARECRRR